MRQRRPRAQARQIQNRHLAAFFYAQQLASLADAMLLKGSPAMVREMLACVRDLTPVLEELLDGGKALKCDGKVKSFRRYQLRRDVNSALGVLHPFPRPPSRAA